MAAGAGFASRIAGAPISWGVCEVPGWGVQLSADRVLAEMRALGLTATERGPAGFLPGDPEEAGGLPARQSTLGDPRHQLKAIQFPHAQREGPGIPALCRKTRAL